MSAPSLEPNLDAAARTGKWIGADRTMLVAASAYIVIILLVWGMFAFSSGLPYETAFTYVSETSSSLKGFFYEADPTRPNTSTFYHVSYLLGELLAPGSFAPYQFVYAALAFARAFLLFLVLRKLLPDFTRLAFLAGALALVHSSDGAMMWVGQMNQFGSIFWMLLAFYLFVAAVQNARVIAAASIMFLAAACEYMSLWSYESGLFIVLLMPAAVLPLVPNWRSRRVLVLSAAWTVMPILYAGQTLLKYMHSSGSTYQESILRTDWSASSIISDLGFNISASLSFWDWGKNSGSAVPATQMTWLAFSAVVVFIGAGLLTKASKSEQEPRVGRGRILTVTVLLVAGLVWVALSFPAFLLLNSARGLWRTQFLSGPGAAVLFAAAATLVASAVPNRRGRHITALCLAAVVVYAGAASVIQRGGYHRRIWETHRRAVAALLRAAPQVSPRTIIVLTGVPKAADPFGADMWFDMALRLAYPGTPVSGEYFFDDGRPGPGNNLKLENGRWHWDSTQLPPLVGSGKLSQTVILAWGAGTDLLLERVPDFLCSPPCNAAEYAPRTRIPGASPSPRAVRRYGPL